MSEIIINMPVKIKNDQSSFEFLICNLYHQIINIKNSKIVLNFKKTRWLEANLTSVLGSIFTLVFKNNNELCLRSINKSIRNVLIKNEFYKNFGIDIELEDTYQSTIKYTRFVPEDKVKFQKYLKEEFIPKINLQMSENFDKELRLNLEEVFQNARTHGKCEYIFVCGQYFYSNKKVTFTIVDLGKTIPENVKNKLQTEINDVDCIDWATKDGNSTKVGISGGIGLFQLSEFLKENEGKMQIISAYGYWEQDNKNITKQILDTPFYGTIVNIQVNINDKLYLSLEEKGTLNQIIGNIF